MTSTLGTIVSVNVGMPRVVEWHGRDVESGIWKAPVDGRVAVRGVNVDGDAQADLRVHGGSDKAVYAYAVEDYAWWSEQLGRPIEPATFGENLTVAGLDLGAMVIGTHWLVGDVELEVAQPRLPVLQARDAHGRRGVRRPLRRRRALRRVPQDRRARATSAPATPSRSSRGRTSCHRSRQEPASR